MQISCNRSHHKITWHFIVVMDMSKQVIFCGASSACEKCQVKEVIEQVNVLLRTPLNSYQLSVSALCFSVFQCLINKDPDVIWFTLCERYCPYKYQSLYTDLLPIKLCGMGRAESEYKQNIMKLLKD